MRQRLSKAKPQAIKASAIWGWLSEEALAGRHLLRDTTTWTNAWMSTEEMDTRVEEAAVAHNVVRFTVFVLNKFTLLCL